MSALAYIESWWKRLGCLRSPGIHTGEEGAMCSEIKDLRELVLELEEAALERETNSAWIDVDDRLPEFGIYVLARHNRGTWSDSTDQDNVNCVVVKRVPAEIEGNNTRSFKWSQFGPDSFFGQTIDCWMPIPEAP